MKSKISSSDGGAKGFVSRCVQFFVVRMSSNSSEDDGGLRKVRDSIITFADRSGFLLWQ